jgi:hypothetical protein
VEGLQARVLHAVLAAHLLNDELRVAVDLELGRAVLARELDAAQERAVLGHVVGGLADGLPYRVHDRALGVRDHDADRGRAGVPAGPAVNVDDELQEATSASAWLAAMTFWAMWPGTSS